MANEIMNKKGELALRNVIFMIIIFSVIISLASVFVSDMANEYENTNMTNEYPLASLGEELYGDVNSSVGTMSSNINEAAGSFGLLTGVISGVGTILKTVITSPLYVKTALETVLTAMNIPSPIPTIVGNAFILLLITMIIFVIVSALSRGGTKL
jgi:hypothetical protein